MGKFSKFYRVLVLGLLAPMYFSSSLFAAETLRIMPLGDSVTYGGQLPPNVLTPDTSLAYRGLLWSKLKENGYDVDFVGSQQAGSSYLTVDDSFDTDGEGHNGFRADEIAANVKKYLEDNPADIVLLHIGTNDFDQGDTSITETVLDVENILSTIDTVNQDIKVIVAKIINKQIYDHNITDYNSEIEIMVKNRISHGDDLILVDMETGAELDYTTDMVDDLHPNPQGYAKIADVWYGAISQTNSASDKAEDVTSDSVDAWSPLGMIILLMLTWLATVSYARTESI